MRGEGGVAGSQKMSTTVHRSPMNFGDVTPYLTYMVSLDNILITVQRDRPSVECRHKWHGLANFLTLIAKP
jgi:hypothetical protein